ncbi:hypothetical protein GCM10017600_03660 [Streptosporangium carneum]|uniref:Uncharacterized protein n=1 Tax=Streptosporangium carneum TaxID=47481 RepID=A0A9W6HV80_9ACTN|nr:hypothetical protein GCM10017600_03660 [Streptosporangium carneum]
MLAVVTDKDDAIHGASVDSASEGTHMGDQLGDDRPGRRRTTVEHCGPYAQVGAGAAHDPAPTGFA